MTIKEMNHPFDIGMVKAIKEKGVKQKYVAEKAGFTDQELSDMLNGRRLIKAHDILMLSLAIGVTADYVYAAGREESIDLKT